jgi:hypothetical protein
MATIRLDVTTARSAVNGAIATLGKRAKRLDKLEGYDFAKLTALPSQLDKLDTVKRLLGDVDAVKGTKAATFKSLYAVRGVLLRRAKSDVDFGGKIITQKLLDAVEPGSGPRDAISDVVRLTTAYLTAGAPKTPYTPAQLKASLAAAQDAVATLGVETVDLDRASLVEQRESLSLAFFKAWRLTVAASAYLDALDDTETRLTSPFAGKRARKAKKAAPVTP